ATQAAATEQVKDSQERGLALLEHHFQDLPVDAGRRDVRTNAVHAEQRQGEEDPVAQVRHAEEISECFYESAHTELPLAPGVLAPLYGSPRKKRRQTPRPPQNNGRPPSG